MKLTQKCLMEADVGDQRICSRREFHVQKAQYKGEFFKIFFWGLGIQKVLLLRCSIWRQNFSVQPHCLYTKLIGTSKKWKILAGLCPYGALVWVICRPMTTMEEKECSLSSYQKCEVLLHFFCTAGQAEYQFLHFADLHQIQCLRSWQENKDRFQGNLCTFTLRSQWLISYVTLCLIMILRDQPQMSDEKSSHNDNDKNMPESIQETICLNAVTSLATWGMIGLEMER